MNSDRGKWGEAGSTPSCFRNTKYPWPCLSSLACSEINRFGKPWESSYRHAEKMLVHEARLLGLTGEDLPPHKPHEHKHYPIQRVYAVGDNPLSDVDGARERV